MDIQNLEGFILESCRFSKSSYTFELCGQIDDEYKTFLVSTSYGFCLLEDNLVDAGASFSLKAWEFLERKVTSISVDIGKQSAKIKFDFEGDIQFLIFSEEELMDNLLIVTDQETGDWFPVS